MPEKAPSGLASLTSVPPMDSPAARRPGIAAALQDHPPPMIILRGPLEHSTSPATDYTEPFRQYMHANYVITKTFPNGDVVWERTNRAQSN